MLVAAVSRAAAAASWYASVAFVLFPSGISRSVLTRSLAPQGKGLGLIGFTSSNCGPSGATASSPNGAEVRSFLARVAGPAHLASQSFLSCGLSKSNPSGGWVRFLSFCPRNILL